MEKAGMILLAGGKSSRMGRDKAWITCGGKPFWQIIGEEMHRCGPVYLSLAAREEWQAGEVLFQEYTIIRDEKENIGPMGGLSSVMHAAPQELFFLGACDMPFLDSSYIKMLLKEWEKTEDEKIDALMVKNKEGRIYVTAGLYHRRLLPVIEEQINRENYRMRALFQNRNIHYLEEESLPEELRRALTNVNTPQDYAKAAKETAALDEKEGIC